MHGHTTACGAQIYEKALQELPGLEDSIAKGEFKQLKVRVER